MATLTKLNSRLTAPPCTKLKMFIFQLIYKDLNLAYKNWWREVSVNCVSGRGREFSIYES